MNIQKIIGLLIISLSFLTIPILGLLVKILYYGDQIRGSYSIYISEYIPNYIYLIVIPFIIGLFLLIYKPKK